MLPRDYVELVPIPPYLDGRAVVNVLIFLHVIPHVGANYIPNTPRKITTYISEITYCAHMESPGKSRTLFYGRKTGFVAFAAINRKIKI